MSAARGRIRIGAGTLRGRPLVSPPGSATRPTASRVREALFDILAERVRGAVFLDAYAGSGAIGIEAASRGAAHVVFVEADPAARRALGKNLELLESTRARATALPQDLGRALSQMGRLELRFDIAFLDPPYGGGELDRAMRLVGASGLLAEGAIVVAEHEAGEEAPAHAELVPYRVARYGGTSLTFHHRAPALVDRGGEPV